MDMIFSLLPRGRLARAFLWALPALLAVMLYINTLGHLYVFDDLGIIKRNPSVHSLEGIRSIIGLAGKPVALRPVTRSTYVLDYFVSSGQPWSFHLTNVLLHGLVTALVYLFIKQVSKSRLAGLIGALLFAAHPIHTGAVAYIQGRRDVLMTVFYLLACILFVSRVNTKRRLWMAAVPLLYFLSFFAKEMAITLPVVLLTYGVWQRLSNRSEGRDTTKKLLGALGHALERSLYLYVSLILLALAFIYYAIYIKPPHHLWGLYGGGLFAHIEFSCRILLMYLRLLVLPINLIADYWPKTIPVFDNPLNVYGLLYLLGAVVTAAILFVLALKWKAGGFWILWILLTLLPVLQIVPHPEPAAEHYLYLPSVGFCAILALGFKKLCELPLKRALGYGMLALVLAAYSARTLTRNPVWKNEYTLWQTTVLQAPNNSRAHYNYAVMCRRIGLDSSAIYHFDRARRIRPEWSKPYQKLAKIYFEKEHYQAAISVLEEGRRLAEPDFKVYVMLAWCYIITGQPQLAGPLYDELAPLAHQVPDTGADYSASRVHGALYQALKIAANDAQGYFRLGEGLLHQGLWVEAMCALIRVRSLAPENVDARYNLAHIHLVYREDTDRCEHELNRILKLDPDNEEALWLRERLQSVKQRLSTELPVDRRASF